MTFDEKAFQAKVKALYELDPYEGFYQEEAIEFVPIKLTRNDEWRQQGQEGTLFRYDKSFFKWTIIAARGQQSGKIFWKQPILLQEDTRRYDRYTCFIDTGEVELPLRIKAGSIEIGIGLQTPPGSFGEPEPGAPRRSFSNRHKPAFPKADLVLDDEARCRRRPDPFRQTGRVITHVALNPHHDYVVWFTPEECECLLDRGYIADVFTEALLGRFFRKRAQYEQTLRERGLL